MKHLIDQDNIYVSMTPGDLVIESLTGLVKKLNLTSGWISGIGAVEDVLIGMYDINTKIYDKKIFREKVIGIVALVIVLAVGLGLLGLFVYSLMGLDRGWFG